MIQAVGLDIGTSKIRCVIGEPSDNGAMNIVGIGQSESRGMRRGIVATTESVVEKVLTQHISYPALGLSQ